MMNQKIKTQWLTALRSGKYKQWQGHLREANKFCCLGVLCDIYSQEKDTPWGVRPNGSKVQTMHGEGGLLPSEVIKWAGLSSMNPKIGDRGLSHLNDNGQTFDQIANAIEAEL